MRGIRIFVAIFVVMFVALMVFNMPRVEQSSAFPTFAPTQVAAKPTSRPITTTPTTAVPPTSCPTSATTTQATTTQSTTGTTTQTTTTRPTTQPTTIKPSTDSNYVIVNGYKLYPNDDIATWYNKDYILNYTYEPVEMGEKDRLWLARLLQSEAGSASDRCAIYTCSSMVNMWLAEDYSSINSMAHNNNLYKGPKAMELQGQDFDHFTPDERIFAIVDYVLGGHRIPKIRFFCTTNYHVYGVPNKGVPYSRPVVQVGPHYFSEYYKWDIKW